MAKRRLQMTPRDRVAMERFGKRLREIRAAQGWSLRSFCIDVDVDPAFLSRLERGLENVSILTLLKIARALNVSVREIVRDI